MNFDFSPDQKSLKDHARKFLAGACPPDRARAVLDKPALAFDRTIWSRIAEMGWLGVTIPEAYGGLGLGPVDLCALAEELGRALAPVPFASTAYVFAEAVLAWGTEAQRERFLPAIVQGDLIGSLATSEGPYERLEARVADGRLSGTKLPVTDGEVADYALVTALEGSDVGMFVVALDHPTVSRRPLKTLDPTRGAAELVFDGSPVEPLGHPGDGIGILQDTLDRAAVLMAFEQIGGADRALEMACEYALQRHAFGRPIAGFQAIKHRLADMYVRNQVARSNAYFGAWSLQEKDNSRGRAAAAARVAASEAYWFAAKEMIEVFGGLGATWEADCHLHYRRARQLSLALGSPVTWRERLAGELEKTFS